MLASHHFKMRERLLSFVQQGGGRLSARNDQNDLNNYEKNEVRQVTNLHNAESESFCNKHQIPLHDNDLLDFAPPFLCLPPHLNSDAKILEPVATTSEANLT